MLVVLLKIWKNIYAHSIASAAFGIAEYEEIAAGYPGGAFESQLVRVTGDFKAKIGSDGPITCAVCG
jgi:hypothetical protein